MIRKFLNMIKQGYYSLVDADASAYPVGQATVNKNATKFTRLSVYGINSNPPKNCHILLLSAQGQESVKFGILNDFLNRKKNLKEGETVLFNSVTGTFVYLKENGDIDIEAPNTNHLGNINVVGDVDIVGNLTVDGNISATGDISAEGDMLAEGDVVADSAGTAISLLQHFHLGNLGYNTGVPEPGAGISPPASPPSSNSSGDVIDGSALNLSVHYHSQGNDGGGDAEVDTSTPLN